MLELVAAGVFCVTDDEEAHLGWRSNGAAVRWVILAIFVEISQHRFYRMLNYSHLVLSCFTQINTACRDHCKNFKK